MVSPLVVLALALTAAPPTEPAKLEALDKPEADVRLAGEARAALRKIRP